MSWIQFMKSVFKLSHQHDYIRLVRLQNPRRDVWECQCGQRYVEYFTHQGNVLAIEAKLQGNSVENCLLSRNNCNLSGSRLL